MAIIAIACNEFCTSYKYRSIKKNALFLCIKSIELVYFSHNYRLFTLKIGICLEVGPKPKIVAVSCNNNNNFL